VKSKQLPSLAVYKANGVHCPAFERNPRIKSSS